MNEEEIKKQLEKACILDEKCYGVDYLFEEDLEAIRSLWRLYQQEKEKNKELNQSVRTKIIGDFNSISLDDLIGNDYISKYKIAKILGLDSTVTTETILQYIEILESENARLEDIEDKKVQIEYELVFNKGVNSMKDKIKAKIEELEEKVKDFEATDNTGRFKKKKSIDYYKIEALKELLEEE